MSSRRTRVAFLCLEAPREGQASYTHVHEIVAGLVQSGWDVRLCKPPHSDRWQRPGIARRILSYAAMQLRFLLVIPRVDIVYIRAHPLAALAAFGALLFRRPVFHEVNGPYGDVFLAHPGAARFRRLITGLQRWQYRHATGLIAVTEGLVRWVQEESGGRPTTLVSNGANTEMFSPAATTGHSLPPRYAVFAGGLTVWHGVDMMRAAVSDPAWPEDLPLVVAGDGPKRPEVEAAARETGRVVALGVVPYREVPGIMAGACVGLVPITDPDGRSSLGGVAPLKLFELMACGVPVVVTDLRGQADLVRAEQCGLVVPVGDGHALAEAVRTLAADSEGARAMGERGCAAVRARHSWAERARETRAFIEACLQSARGRRPAPSRRADSSR